MSLFKNICKLTCLVLIFVSHAKGSENKTCNVLLNNYLVYDIFEKDPDVLESINATPSFDLVYTGRYAGPTVKAHHLIESRYLNLGPEFKTKRLEITYYNKQETSRSSDLKLVTELSKPENKSYYGSGFINSRGYWEPSLTLIDLKFGTSVAMYMVRNILPIRDKKTHEVIGILNMSLDTHSKTYYLAYLIFKQYRRQGFGSEALLGAVDKIRTNTPNFQITLYILEDNVASQKLAEAVGFEKISSDKKSFPGFEYKFP